MLPEELMRLSPRYFHRLRQAKRKHRAHATDVLEVALARLTAIVANTGFRGGEEPRQPQEFLVSRHLMPREPKRRRRVERPEEAADQLRAFFEKRMAARNSA